MWRGPMKWVPKMDAEWGDTEVTSDPNMITFIGAIEAETRSKQAEEEWGLSGPS